MNMPKENLHTDKTKNKRYVFAQKQGDDFSCIKLTEGVYKDIVYKYNHVKFSQTENEDGEIPLKFTFDILSNPSKASIDTEEFKVYIGDILVELVEEQLKNGSIIFE
tara:strand:+ start:1862 stop:2182 length:321 start_codon:yes stop_codon:yes gene_type:complete